MTYDENLSEQTACPAEGCPGLEWHDGRPVGCGHPTKTSDCEGTATVLYIAWFERNGKPSDQA